MARKQREGYHLPWHMRRLLDTLLTEQLPSRLVWMTLLVGVALRSTVALTDHGIYWPDEIYQSLEVAHRLVFGTGLLAWEYLEGARSWFFPALMSVPLWLAKWAGLDWPEAYLFVTRLFLLAAAVGTALGARSLARRMGATALGASLAVVLFALIGPAIYFSHRALTETVSALPASWGLALALPPGASRRERTLGSVLLALAVFMRLQNGLLCTGLVLALLLRRAFRPAAETFGVLSVMALLLGLLDLATWGSPFHSARVYLAFNVLEDGASSWGVAGPGYYLRHFLSSVGEPFGVALLVLALVGACRQWALSLVIALFLAGHLAVGHKELRFLFPVLPLLGVLAGFGLEQLFQARAFAGRLALLGLSLGAVFSGVRVFWMRMEDVGQYLETRPRSPALHDAEAVNRLLLRAHRQPDVCGLKIESQHLAWTGGYTYLHRDVPLYAAWGPGRESGRFNYVITFAEAAGAGSVERRGRHALVKLSDRCVPDPLFRQTLEQRAGRRPN